jgi:hypothetical protein
VVRGKLAANGSLAKFLFDKTCKNCLSVGMEKKQLHGAFKKSSDDMFGDNVVEGVSSVLDFFANCFGIPTMDTNKSNTYRR